MPWMFRTYSDSSHAVNGPDGFAPAAALSRGGKVNDYHAPAYLEDMRKQLELAMSGRKSAVHNPFVFFTPSLLLALQFAHFRKGGGLKGGVAEQNIRITCFDTDQALTPHGVPVKFACMEDMTKELGIKEVLDYGVPRSHHAEFVTMDCVVLRSARTASLQDILDQGLYQLYPAIQEANSNTKSEPRVNLELRKLRNFCFPESGTIRSCGPERIDLAAKLAATFKSTSLREERVAGHLLAWMLSLTKRDASGLSVISKWLDEKAHPRPSDVMDHDAGFAIDTTRMPEVSQFLEILPMMSDIVIENKALFATTSISAKDNQKELFDWRDEQHIDNAQFQEVRKLNQAAKQVVKKEKTAVKKAKVTEKKDAEAAKKRKDRERSQKKKAAEKVAKDKKRTKLAKDKVAKGKEKEKREKEKIAKEKAKEKADRKAATYAKKIEAAEKAKEVQARKFEALMKKTAPI